MKRFSLNNDWQFTEGNLSNPLLVNMLSGWRKISLPHDAQILKERDPAAPTADNEGWTQGLAAFYKKEFVIEPEAAGKRFWLEFEGIAGVCQIWVNGKYLAKHMNPYTSVVREVTCLVHTGENTIQVHVDSRMKPNSRWYVGTGLYRSVWLHMGEQAAVIPQTLHAVTTKLEGGRAVLAEVPATMDGDKAAAELTVSGITPWCPETPELYTVACIVAAGEAADEYAVRTGIRTVSVDPKNGFRLNGVPMKLRGGCVHHDMGMLGAADYPAAEQWRIQKLLDSGFNALRGAHNPFGPAFYEVCDELGMLVIEEAFDEWVLGRTDFGLHITFEDRWERDLEDMVGRDFNHPCVVMWSTGNEVEERDGSADGFAWAKRLADKVRALDASRPVSASACSLFIEYTQRPPAGATGNQALNMAYDGFADGRDLWGPGTEGYFAPLDVAGYNYKTARYAYDGEKYPERVIYGSETYPCAALESWQATEQNSHVIGDFVWTAWEYLGEVGIGRWEVSDAERPGPTAYPWMLANCGDFDLLGQKRPQSYYRDLVWKRGSGPKLFCLPPELTGKHLARLAWAWLPVRRSYTFNGCEGQDVEVHVYADADEVELLQNGVSTGKLPCTEAEGYTAVFTVPYQPGRLEAVAFRGGQETGRDVLATAGATASLVLEADAQGELTFVTVRAVDAAGVPVWDEVGEVSVTLSGGELLALGSADPKPDRKVLYSGTSCPLYEGAAMAVVKPGVGCTLTVSLGGITAEVALAGTPAPAAGGPVHDVIPGPMDMPLGALMENAAALAVLKTYLGPVLASPMIGAMKGLSLKKIFAMSGGQAPEGMDAALRKAMQG